MSDNEHFELEYIKEIRRKNFKYCFNIIKKTFPFKVDSIKRCGEGQDCIAMIINDEYIVKIPKSELALTKLLNENSILKSLETKNFQLNTPKFIDNVITKDKNIPLYSIISKMDGKQLSRKIFNKLAGINKNELAKNIAQFLYGLHNVEIDSVCFSKIDILENLRADYNHILNNYVNYFSNELQIKLKKFYQDIESFYNSLEIKYSILHGDFSINVIYYDIENNKTLGIIDFGDSIISDRDSDFIYLLEDLEDYPFEFGAKVANYYNEMGGEIDIDLIKKKIALDNDYWCVKQIIKGEKLNDSKLIKKSIKKLIATIKILK